MRFARFTWTAPKHPVVGLVNCRELLIAGEKLAYLIGRPPGEEFWFALHSGENNDDLWVAAATSREHARELAEEHARRQIN